MRTDDSLFVRGIAKLATLVFVCLGFVLIVVRSWADLEAETAWLLLGICGLVIGGLVITIRQMVRQTPSTPTSEPHALPAAAAATGSILVRGLRNPDPVQRWCEASLVDIAYVVATTPDGLELDLDPALSLGDADDREFVATLLREGLSMCNEEQATIDMGSKAPHPRSAA